MLERYLVSARSLPALLLPPLVKLFLALIPAVLSKAMNHTPAQASPLPEQGICSEVCSAQLTETRDYNPPVDSDITTVLRNSSKDFKELAAALVEARQESISVNFLTAVPALTPETAASPEAALHPEEGTSPGQRYWEILISASCYLWASWQKGPFSIHGFSSNAAAVAKAGALAHPAIRPLGCGLALMVSNRSSIFWGIKKKKKVPQL
ncbi:uncharacterized protein LOC112970561 [Apteryx rowi]|uniref:uncharacterized protein LOC112970561 n=1 Tax=Apteryx rowi TaxID=308060 RepID=UPI000E1CAD92|nr:uncharacterized protein LOC112970561 [Apteryx rowi]